MGDSVGVRVGVASIVELVSAMAVEVAVAVADAVLVLAVELRATCWAASYVLRIDANGGLKRRGSR